MGRAIVRRPQVFLMDEPLSNLDAKLRVQTRAEIARIQRDLAVTTIYVTHDQVEAMTLGHRVAVMRKGLLQQVDAPQVLYDRPTNLFVAGFIGSPAMNLLEGRFERAPGDDGLVLHLGDQQLTVPGSLLQDRPALAARLGQPVAVGIRPEDMDDAALAGEGGGPGRVLHANVELLEAMGSDLMAHLSVAIPLARTEEVQEIREDLGAAAPLDLAQAPAASTRLVARFNPRSTVQEGDRVAVAVDTARVHVFDLGTGEAIWS
jgi:multiple sugar transport system ATP-binding protein